MPLGLAQRLPRLWYRARLDPRLWPLLPLSGLFGVVAALRRALFRHRLLASQRLPVSVIVVGNLTVGGSGKTPLTIWLVQRLAELGLHPGVISRGYGGAGAGVRAVEADSAVAEVGDEPLLIARRCAVPVFVGRDRVAAGRALLAAHPACDVIVCDDGLQHYRLRRDLEIAVFDARAAGNRCLLPAGPLREPLSRLSSVDAVVWNSAPADAHFALAVPQYRMRLRAAAFYALADRSRQCTADALRGRKLFALAGIGDPSRFFAQLAALGLAFEARAFADHHAYTASDFAFARDGVLLMTEKDAVKCAAFPLPDAWVLPVAACFDADDGEALSDRLLEKLNHGRTFA